MCFPSFDKNNGKWPNWGAEGGTIKPRCVRQTLGWYRSRNTVRIHIQVGQCMRCQNIWLKMVKTQRGCLDLCNWEVPKCHSCTDIQILKYCHPVWSCALLLPASNGDGFMLCSIYTAEQLIIRLADAHPNYATCRLTQLGKLSKNFNCDQNEICASISI